jgi:hypothetical protein
VIERPLKITLVLASDEPPNNTFDRTAGSHLLAPAGERERWAAQGSAHAR